MIAFFVVFGIPLLIGSLYVLTWLNAEWRAEARGTWRKPTAHPQQYEFSSSAWTGR